MAKQASPADGNPHSPIFAPDRRRAARHPVRLPAYASVSGSAPRAITDLNAIMNISEAGICVQFAAPMKAKRLLPLCLELSETGSRIYVVGHVAWSEPSGETGIRFPDMSEASHAQLQQWLLANEKSETLASVAGSSQPSHETSATASTTAANSCMVSLTKEWAEMERELESHGTDLDSALHLIAQRALTLTWASGAAIALIDRSISSQMICRARAGSDAPGIGVRLEVGSGFSGECVRSGQTITCTNADDDPRVDHESCRALGIRSIVATPVKHWGEVIGVLEIFSSEQAAFSQNDAAILERLTVFIAGAVQRTDIPHGNAPMSPLFNQTNGNASEEYPSDLLPGDFAEPAYPTGRRIALGAITALCLLAVAWMLAPLIARLWSSAPTFAAPSAQANSSPDTYVLMSISDLTARANQGDARAQYALGMRYTSGIDVSQDFREAKDWFLQAAEQGNVAAQSKIAAAFWEGRGVSQDYSKSYFWALLAQAGGDELSKQIVVSSAARLSPVQISVEQKEADRWLHSHHIGQPTQ